MTSTRRFRQAGQRLPGGERVVRLIGVDPADAPDTTALTYLVLLPDGNYRTLTECVPATVSVPNPTDCAFQESE